MLGGLGGMSPNSRVLGPHFVKALLAKGAVHHIPASLDGPFIDLAYSVVQRHP